MTAAEELRAASESDDGAAVMAKMRAAFAGLAGARRDAAAKLAAMLLDGGESPGSLAELLAEAARLAREASDAEVHEVLAGD